MNALHEALKRIRDSAAPYQPELERAARSAARLAAIPGMIADCVVDVRLRSATVAHLSPSRAVLAESAAAGRSMYVHGNAGAGKSFLAVAAFRRRLTLEAADLAAEDLDRAPSSPLEGFGLGIHYVAADDLIRDMQREIGNDGNAQGLLDRVADARWLALDDLGNRSRLTPYVADELAALIDSRYRRCLPTLITSNLSVPELASLIGKATDAAKWQASRVESRIYGMIRGCGLGEDGGDLWPEAQPVVIGGEDRRR